MITNSSLTHNGIMQWTFSSKTDDLIFLKLETKSFAICSDFLPCHFISSFYMPEKITSKWWFLGMVSWKLIVEKLDQMLLSFYLWNIVPFIVSCFLIAIHFTLTWVFSQRKIMLPFLNWCRCRDLKSSFRGSMF